MSLSSVLHKLEPPAVLDPRENQKNKRQEVLQPRIIRKQAKQTGLVFFLFHVEHVLFSAAITSDAGQSLLTILGNSSRVVYSPGTLTAQTGAPVERMDIR